MSANVSKQLVDNISIILKKSLSADATLAELRNNKQASFEAIFKKEAGFTCTANTFQPYVEEIANDGILAKDLRPSDVNRYREKDRATLYGTS